jgi:Spy/CpxP family protein refolding chaperone
MTRNHFFTLASLPLLYGTLALAQAATTIPGPPPAPANDSPAPKARAKAVRDMQYRVTTRDNPQFGIATADSGPRADLRIAPPGMWWKSSDIAQRLSLTTDQQKRMDDIFQQSRLQLIDLKANVEKQEVMLEPMLAANPPDTNKVLAQIDHVASARAELEKANARMLLGIRGVLSADQWTKLQAEHLENRRVMMFRTPGGPGMMFQGPDGPKGPGGPESFHFRTPDHGDKIGPGGPLSMMALPPIAMGEGFSVITGGPLPDLDMLDAVLLDDDLDL